jgi:selenocysteine lyase/cysteine desulfurase
MTSRRSFLGGLSGLLALPVLQSRLYAGGLQEQLGRIAGTAPETTASDEDFWSWVREAYTVSPGLINLNNGGVSPQPRTVQEAMIRYYQMSNEGPSYYMWRILDKGREALRAKLAALAGCSPDELAINRNASEALETVIFGLPLKAGDEVVLTKQDYPNMINAWKQRALRDGVKLVWLNLDLPAEDDDALVSRFEKAFTPRTKVVQVTHVINWTGQILPARRIADAAHSRGIDVLLDAAHSFGQLDFTFPETGCDYAGTSLHKWLCAPFGSGMLYIRKEKIPGVWPLLANDKPQSGDIRKFESLGTRSFPIEQAVGQAVDFHLAIGTRRKQERLKYLKAYWSEQVKDMPGIRFYTSLRPERSCALCNFGLDGVKTADLEARLLDKYRIHTSPIVWENIDGVRVTPHVYTQPQELDLLVRAIREIAASPGGK